jgi:hypothetical protein
MSTSGSRAGKVSEMERVVVSEELREESSLRHPETYYVYIFLSDTL